MFYVVAYLGVGVLVLIGIGIDNFVRRSRETSEWGELADEIRRAGQSRVQVLLERDLLPVIAGVGIVGAWPVALVFAVRFYRNRQADTEEDLGAFERKSFTVERRHLLDSFTVQDIENQEIINDPLNAVPAKAFGHLNPAWLEFRSRVKPTDRIWSFQAEWGEFGRMTEVRSGYALVRDDSVVSHFTKGIRPIEPRLIEVDLDLPR
jgi:hypothetical protein